MKNIFFQGIKNAYENMKLNRKIQLSLLLVILPTVILFMFLFFNVYNYNQKYDRIISNASEAGRFSINFKEEFDYKIYLLIAGHSTFEEEDPYSYINTYRSITEDLIKNTGIKENRHRAEKMLKLLNNLEKYVRRIEDNKKAGGHYDDNFSIWENDVQIVTSLIQTTVFEYVYYETVSMEHMRSKLASSLDKITVFSITVFVLLVAIAIFMSIIIPNSIVKPIHQLIDITNQVAQGDLTVRADTFNSIDVRKLGYSLNSMIEKIDHLLKKVKMDENNLRRAELEILQEQINPHFLYNTLETIIWLTEGGKQNEVLEMVKSLSDFFRTSLSKGNGMVTLRQEERHIRSYLQIQYLRYKDILEYSIDIPEYLKDAIIPKISLQPIVENALYHGIKNRRRKGSIMVSASMDSNDIVISVTDNGIGMTDETVNQLLKSIKQRNSEINDTVSKCESYGLYNVNERLRLKFGESYGLSISSIYGEGTCVKIKIPFITDLSKNNQTKS